MFKIPDDKILILDGAMGTMLQGRGLRTGDIPEKLNITDIGVIESIHREYLEAGADVVSANTFGANRFKAEKAGYSLENMVIPAVRAAKRAAAAYGKYAALDIGPCGRVLQPSGDLSFEDAVEVFAEIVRAGRQAGADLILLETFTDLYELKAAVLAAKENSDLPVLASMSFEENGYSFFGTSIEAMVLTLEGLGADALGVNCSLGPKQLAPIVERIIAQAGIPVLVQPNAGLPVMENGVSRYDVTSDTFADYCLSFARSGARVLGGCCGTTPEYTAKIKALVSGLTPITRATGRGRPKKVTAICSPSKAVSFGGDTVIIGERLNPTGKKALQAAIRAGDMDYLLREAVKQQEQGAHVLDVNVGLPDIDEPATLVRAVREVQGIVDLPLQLDSSNAAALEAAARVYNGKPLINSVNGKKESLESILPIAKKYGAAVLGLTLDERGIPETAEERLAIAVKIVEAAERYGIAREDVLIDCLVMTASAQQEQAAETLRAVRAVKEELGLKTVLGVSNVSFGLPDRPVINRVMLALALGQGLDAPIMNPGDKGMAETVAAFRVLSGKDPDAGDYIKKYSAQEAAAPAAADTGTKPTLAYAIARGLKNEAEQATNELLAKHSPLEIVESHIIPALDEVGKDYETQKIFLPQLIKAAEAAKSSFEILRREISKEGGEPGAGSKKIVIATVYGDIHDIGKNIVKVIMENYNFDVIDLGRDVPPEEVVRAVTESGAKIAGLSALMTTTVASMKDTIALLREKCPGTKIIVGGAVLTSRLAEQIGADFYAADALETVRIASGI